MWQSLTTTVPTDGQVVWCRVDPFGDPFLGTWSVTLQTFTLTSGLIAPWYSISRWKSQ